MSPPAFPGFPAALLPSFTPRRLLGQGGMGSIVAAHDRALDRDVAIKLMLRPGDETQAARFRREAAILASLRHPGVVQVYSFGETEQGPYLVMELLEATPLGACEDLQLAVSALHDVAEALDEVHAAGLIHRDVKPDNILVTPAGRGVLVDFGLVHDGRRTQLTETGQVLGTLAYLAPELLTGMPVTAAADWYGWGACLYALVEGAPPRRVDQLVAWATGKRALPALRFQALAPGSALHRLLVSLLDPDASRRPGAAHEVRAPLGTWRSTLAPGGSPEVVRREPVPAAAAPRNRRGAPALAATLLALGGLGWMVQPGPPGSTESPRPSRPPGGAGVPDLDGLRQRIAELAAPHRDATGRLLGSRELDHIRAIRLEVLGARTPLRFRRLLELQAEAWTRLRALDPERGPAGELVLPGEVQHLLHESLQVLGHLLDDLEVLAEGGDPHLSGPELLVSMERAASASAPLLPEARRWLLESRDPDRAQGLLGAYGNLATRVLHHEGGACGPTWQGHLQVIEHLATTTEAARRRLTLNAALKALNLLRRALDECGPLPVADAVLPLRRLLDRPLDLGSGPTSWSFGDLTAVGRAFRKRAGPPADPAALDLGQALWWWAFRGELLQAEPAWVRRLLDRPGHGARPVEQAHAALAAFREAPGWSAALQDATDELLAALVAALAEPSAGLTFEDVRVIVEALVTGMARSRLGGQAAAERTRTLVHAALARLDLPTAAPRADRWLLLGGLSRPAAYPGGMRLPGQATAFGSELGRPTQEALWGARKEIMDWARTLSQPSGGAWPPACPVARAMARAPQQELSDVNLSDALGLLDWDLTFRVRHGVTCLHACEPELCTEQPGQLERWLQEIEAMPASRARDMLRSVCEENLPAWSEADAGLSAVRPEAGRAMARLRQVCHGLGL